MRARLLGLAAVSAILLVSCQAPPPPAPLPEERVDGFSAERAWSHVEALAAAGPRSVGSEGNAEAREYLKDQLEELGLEIVAQRVEVQVGDREPFDLVNIAARIRGQSEDAIVLAAGYDTTPIDSFEYLGVNEAASGPAVLLELGRVLSEQTLAYTTWLVFLDGEAPSGPGKSPNHFGSSALAKRLAEEGVLDQIRLAVVIEKVCDPDLRIARDLSSQRVYREEFWRAAARLGHREIFDREQYQSPSASHRPLSDAGLRRVVALVDTSFGGGDPPGVYAGTADDDLAHCSAESLETVGSVTLEALGVIAQRLAKIDRFAASPVAEAQALAWDTLGPAGAEGSSPEEEESGESAESVSDAADEVPAAEAPSADSEPGAPASRSVEDSR